MQAVVKRNFSVQYARELIKDLFEHKAWIYWTDLLVTLTIGYSAAMIYFNYPAPIWSWQRVLAYFVAGFALFRAASWIHEIVHFRGKELQWFTIGWNILAGIPMLTPSFFYTNHIDHHSTKHYGTGQDGEYLPLGSGPLREIVYFWLQVFALPIAIYFRFLIITPLSFMCPPLRKWALERFSSFVINLKYRHEIPRGAPLFWWAVIEFCCFLRAAALLLFVAMRWAPLERIPLIYSLALIALGLNYVRNMVAHHYRSNGEPMAHVDQLFDSVNLRGMPIVTELFFPLGLRYHALHHLFPSLPYHSLAKAHRRLLAQLPTDSGYHETVYAGFWSVFRDVVKNARVVSAERRAAKRTIADEWYDRREQLLAERYDSRSLREGGERREGEAPAEPCMPDHHYHEAATAPPESLNGDAAPTGSQLAPA
jgi:fatty acid desaturase